MGNIIKLEQKLKELNISTTRKLTMKELLEVIAEKWNKINDDDQKELLTLIAEPEYNKNEIIDILISIKDNYDLTRKQRDAINIACNNLK